MHSKSRALPVAAIAACALALSVPAHAQPAPAGKTAEQVSPAMQFIGASLGVYLALLRQNGYLRGRSGAVGRRPAIPAPGSALGSHPCVATILRPGEASIAGMPRHSHTNQKLLAAAATDAVQQRQVLAAVRWPVLK